MGQAAQEHDGFRLSWGAVFSKMAASWDRTVQSLTPNVRAASSTDAARAMSCARRASAGVSLKYSSSRRTGGTGKVYRAFLSMPRTRGHPLFLRTSAEGSARANCRIRVWRDAQLWTPRRHLHDAVTRSPTWRSSDIIALIRRSAARRARQRHTVIPPLVATRHAQCQTQT